MQLESYNNDIANENSNNNDKYPEWAVIAGMVEEVEHPIPTKYPISYAQNMASNSKVQHLIFTWRNYLKQTREWAKTEKLAPSN